jgi:mRNA interferase MazF
MRRAEVRWYRFVSPDKRRPVVVLTRDSIIDLLSEITIAPITTSIRQIPSEVVLGTSDGMPRECAINLDHVQTVAKTRLGPLITTLSHARMADIRAALLFALGY